MPHQLANVLVALGGDRRNTVPRYRVTAPEIAVLTAIHGSDAVHEIEALTDFGPLSDRDEKARLAAEYTARNSENEAWVEVVYPGRAPALHETIGDLELPPELFRAERKAPEPVERPRVLKAPKKGKPKPAPVAEIVPAAAGADSVDALFDEGDEEAADDEAANVMA